MLVEHVSPTTRARCTCVRRHRPEPLVLHRHHVVPQSWGGPTVAANLETICPTVHMSAHALIDLYVTLGRVPTRAELLVRFGRWPSRRARDLAARAWAGRPAHPTPTS